MMQSKNDKEGLIINCWHCASWLPQYNAFSESEENEICKREDQKA